MMMRLGCRSENVAMVENIAQYLDEDVEVGLEVERKENRKILEVFRYR